jgi:hypothetical protein
MEVPVLATALLVALVFAVITSVPAWPYTAKWNYYPMGGLGVVLLVVLLTLMLAPRA